MSQWAWSEARKTITSATSWGMPHRRSGVPAEMAVSCSGVSQPLWIGPGATMLTVMPYFPTSIAAERL